MKAMDDINARYGHRTVTFASAGLPLRRERPLEDELLKSLSGADNELEGAGYSQGVNPGIFPEDTQYSVSAGRRIREEYDS